jgi:NADP-reducing hydrogenase subunit HndB
MIELDFLKKVDIFKGLDDDRLIQIQAGCRKKTYQSGQKLFAEAEKADRLWIVMDGSVDLRFDLPGRPTSAENTIFSITTGRTMGWSSFVPPCKYKLSAYCTTRRCTMIQIRKDHLLNLFAKDARMGYTVISNLTGVASIHFHHLQNSAAGPPPPAGVKVTVHMATCGIAAGARAVMNALMEELYASERQDIEVKTGGCLGQCASEPNLTVERSGEEPVIYQKMTPEKIRRVFRNHILKGEIQTEFQLGP